MNITHTILGIAVALVLIEPQAAAKTSINLQKFDDKFVWQMADQADGMCRGAVPSGVSYDDVCALRDQLYDVLITRGYCLSPGGHDPRKCKPGDKPPFYEFSK